MPLHFTPYTKKNRISLAGMRFFLYLCSRNSFCGISTSVVHRLPKPRRRVRFPYAALVGMGLQQEMRPAHLGCRHSSSYLELTKLSVEDEEHEAELRDLTRKARWRTTSAKARHNPPKAHNLLQSKTPPAQSAHNFGEADTTCAKRT